MAEENAEQTVTDAVADEPKTQSGSPVGKILQIALPVGVLLVAAVAGYFVRQMGSSTTPTQVEASSTPEETPGATGDEQYAYFDLPTVIVNLNDPGLTRYIRATLTLVVRNEDHGEAKDVLEKRISEVKNWLIVYLSDLSVDEVRGAKNLRRISREIQDSLNERLWPGDRPLITHVDYKDWAVQ